MRKIVVFLLFVLCTAAQSQSFKLFDIDTTNFPTMKAKFYAFDADGKQITNLSPNDFEVKENGVKRTVTNVSCPAPKPLEKVSVAMSLDVSGSMAFTDFGEIPVELGKTTAKQLVDLISMPPSEFALQTCNDVSMIIQDLTTNKSKILAGIVPISAWGDNDFVEQLLNPRTGLINIAKIGKNKLAAVIYTDAWWDKLTDDELQRCIDTCSKYNIQFYAIIYSRPEAEPDGIKLSLQELANATGGYLYDGVTSEAVAKDIAHRLKIVTQGGSPCTIEWESGVSCKSSQIEVKAEITAQNINDKLTYYSPSKSIVNLIINPEGIHFKNIPLGTTKDTTITITAINSDFNITNITYSNPVFKIEKTNFYLANGKSIDLKISYTPKDSSYVFSKFNIETNLCNSDFWIVGYYTKAKQKTNTLKLTHPNGGEFFVVGSDTIITWEGIPATDTVKLEFSNDNGITWQNISDSATGLTYFWENIPKPSSKQCLVRVKQFPLENTKTIPEIEWQKNFGGSQKDEVYSIKQTLDGGYIFAGNTNSKDCDLSENHGNMDVWIVKIDPSGVIEWQKNLGGSQDDIAQSIQQTSDGGYIFAGFSNSNDGDLINNKGDTDYWIVKLDITGAIEWQKNLGGGLEDKAYSIQQTTDGGYIVAGHSFSSNGDVTKNYGNKDYWILKLNSKGDIEWEKSYGGSSEESAYSIQQTAEGGYIAAGYSVSFSDIYKPDYWILKLNKSGQIDWSTTKNASTPYYAHFIQQTKDGGYVFTGETYLLEANGYQLLSTYYISKLNICGDLSWHKLYGGRGDEVPYSIQQTNDSGYVVAGYTESNNGDISKNNGHVDYWIVKTDSKGNMKWEKNLGGSMNDHSYSIQQTSDNGYIIAGVTYSNDGDLIENKGNLDVWIVKLSQEKKIYFQEDVSDSLFAIVAPQASANDIDMKQCLVGKAKDSVITPFVSNIGTYKFRVDSIYFTGSDANCFSLVSGFPEYEITPNSSHQAEIHFVPNRAGLHSAQINIMTQSDTLIKNIIGEGIEPQLKILTDLLDFGMIEIGNDTTIKDTSLLKNISNSNITINNVVQLGPDLTQFEIIDGGGSFTLAPNEERKLTLKFKPKYGGRTSGQLGFEYSGAGSPAIARLFGTGIGGSVSVANDSAYAGEKLNLKLVLGNIKPEGLAEIAPIYEATVRFQNSILATLNINGSWSLVSDSIYLNISGTVGSSINIAEIPVLAGLGTVEETSIDIVNFVFKDNSGNPIEYDVETVSGSFKLLGICGEGGKRLFFGSGKAGLLSIIPNPADGEVTLTINTIEEGETYIYIYNAIGMEIYKNIINSDVSGRKEIKLNTSNYSAGVYYIKFQTPTFIEFKKIIINR